MAVSYDGRFLQNFVNVLVFPFMWERPKHEQCSHSQPRVCEHCTQELDLEVPPRAISGL
jgi:hypothetical protein